MCLSGSSLINGQCVLCPVGCSLCSSVTVSNCLACALGNYYNEANGSCLACSSNCAICNANGCTSCFDKYIISASSICISKCLDPCSTCDPANSTNCRSCVAGYDWIAKIGCVPDLNCNRDNTCTVCPFTYSLSYQSSTIFSYQNCVACRSSSNCARCNPNNPSQCISCSMGTWLTSINVC